MIIMSERKELGVLHVLVMEKKDGVLKWPDDRVRQIILTLAMLDGDRRFLALPFIARELPDHSLAPALISKADFVELSSYFSNRPLSSKITTD